MVGVDPSVTPMVEDLLSRRHWSGISVTAETGAGPRCEGINIGACVMIATDT